MIIKKEKDEIQSYLSDASNTKGYCESVYFPKNKYDVIEIIRSANLLKTHVTISGNRTGVTGAAVPQGGIILATDKLNKMLEINVEEKYAIVEPGVLLSDFQKELQKHSLLYPPDPTETNCFIGGTVATNASGAKTFKYGPTRAYVLALEIVLPTGDVINLNRNEIFADQNNLHLRTDEGKLIKAELPDLQMPETKNAAGYFCKAGMDAVDLFIGSEGTLGIFTKIKLKLLQKPANVISCVLFFSSEDSTLDFISEARNISKNSNSTNSINALALEYFDEKALEFLKDDYPKLPSNCKAAVWFEQETTSENENDLIEKWLQFFTKYSGREDNAWFSMSDKDREQLKDFRHRISAKVNDYITVKNFRKLGTDVAVPDSAFITFYHRIKKIVEDAGIKYVIYGHAGNSNIHLNMLPENEGQYTTALSLYKEICSIAIREDGTFSAEHGVGKNKTTMLIEMYGKDNVQKLKNLKKVFDPNMILGIGNIFK